MSEFEDRLALALREQAEDEEVHVGALLDSAQRLGRRYQRRRRAVGLGAGGALAVAAMVGVSVAVPALSHRSGPVAGGPVQAAGSGSRSPDASPTVGAAATWPALPRPPVAAGATPLAADPAAVGVNPLLLHFDVDSTALTGPFVSAQWSSVGGVEQLTVEQAVTGTAAASTPAGAAAPASVARAPAPSASLLRMPAPSASTQATPRRVSGRPGAEVAVLSSTVRVSPSRAGLDPLDGRTRQVRVGGLAATLAVTGSGTERSGEVRWQPLPGVWAQVQTYGDDAAILRLARGVTFDRVLRCTVPFRLGGAPAGSTVDGCTLSFSGGRSTGRVTINIRNGGYVTVEQDPGPLTGATGTRIGPRFAREREYGGDGGALIFQIDIDFGDHIVDLLAEGHYDKSVVLRMAVGYAELGSTDPESWPTSPLP